MNNPRLSMIRIVRILFILNTGLAFTGLAQANDNVNSEPEQLYVHLDKPFYTTSETIWYKVYFLNQDTSEVESNIVYLDLISPVGEIVAHQKLLRNGLSANGEITVPPKWKEGYYTLRCYTRWNLNFGDEAIFLQRVPIYNPYEDSNSPNTLSVVQLPTKPDSQDLNINLQMQQQVYGKSDSVRVTIAVADINKQPVKANLSLAVLDTDLTTLKENKKTTGRSTRPPAPALLEFAPEKALSLPLTITSPATSEPVSSQFVSVYRVENQDFINTSVEQGELSVPLSNFFGSRTFQVHNHNPFQAATPNVTVRSVLDSLPLPNLPDHSPPRTPEIERCLYLSKLRNKFSEIFETNLPVHNSDSEIKATAFAPNKSYLMEKFQLIKTVEEFVANVLVKTNVLTENGRKSVRLFDPFDQRYLENSPWYLVNGYLTTQEGDVLSMAINKIEKIEFYIQPETVKQQFPFLMARGGVIAIYTKDRKPPTELVTDHNTFTWQGFHSPQSFNSSESTLIQDNKAPDFRPLVYWKPIIETDDRGKATITFPTSKAIGQFTVQAEGVSATGSFGRAETTYQTQFTP